MVAGHLQIKNNVYYMVLSYTDEQTGKRKWKWISTGLQTKGNKTRAEKMLAEARKTFEPPKAQSGDLTSDMKFSDFRQQIFLCCLFVSAIHHALLSSDLG